ncbi:phosphotransferase enzyme domain protein [Bifidobacterium saguini DSM 23967]|uniref:Phosphotransferase enzyme domain protein n=2 Tax=Bifidobacterium saguini TaxID=762210 RepID=A0A087DF99_9BIFI|nr:phosphotransferase [Bifidobacterium saguini]KFI94199.1 phosphotransferase enzyme domain protein [Bifidobacterium saguini DSM 23967]QTB90490.1 phosphotransferase [Bifidobacterium saguini]
MRRSNYMLAALTSAVLPNLAVAGVRESTQQSATDQAKGIDQAVIQDASGKLYDVYATDTKEGRTRLIRRVQAAQTLSAAREPGGLGFGLDRIIAFAPGNVPQPGATSTAQALDQSPAAAAKKPVKPGPTGETTVMIASHLDGQARSLDLLTLDDCASVGTALGAIHRLPTAFLKASKYPVFTTGQIRSQLIAWIKRLRAAGHVPQEITNSWARIIETEGLWSFATCTVHGGFSDGDLLFSGSTITAITNWQDMQVNDPARDLAWIFGKLDESHRNAVLSAYGRMMGSRLDDLIMLRANLWLQMEQVGEFISALNRADNDRIIQFKAQVERLAHQLGVINRSTATTASQSHASGKSGDNPSTITVGTLLNDDAKKSQHSNTAAQPSDVAAASASPATSDDTNDPDRTGSADIIAAGSVDVTPKVTTAAVRQAAQTMAAANQDDQTANRPVTATGSTKPQPANEPRPASASTITLKELIDMNEREQAKQSADAVNAPAPMDAAQQQAAAADDDDDDTGEHAPQSWNSVETTVIPLLEREERALRDARAGLSGYDHEGNTMTSQQASTPQA